MTNKPINRQLYLLSLLASLGFSKSMRFAHLRTAPTFCRNTAAKRKKGNLKKENIAASKIADNMS